MLVADINRRNVIHQRRAVLGAESQPLIGKLLIAFWAAPHSFGGAATNRRFGPSRPVANTFRNEPAGDETSSRLTALQICSHQLELTKKVRNLDCRAFSSESEPCVAFSPTDPPNSLRIVPSSAFAGSVTPIKSRHAFTAPSFSRVSTTHGPLDMNSVKPAKNGLSRWTA